MLSDMIDYQISDMIDYQMSLQYKINIVKLRIKGNTMFLGKENRQSKATLPEFQGGSFQQYMEVLYNHQKTCEKTGKYMEAETAKKRLTKMKSQLEKQRREEMFGKHQQQKRQVELAHIEEITEFNNYWDGKMLEYQNESEKMENQYIQKHENELSAFEEEIDRSLGVRPKESGEMINLRKIEESLAKQEKYVEAHKVQRQIQQLERNQYEKWNLTKNVKIKNLMGQLRIKQENELNALRQRIEQGFEEQKKIRNQEYQKLIQKYQNFIKELENHHHQETIKFDKTIKMQSSINFSRVSNMSNALKSRN